MVWNNILDTFISCEHGQSRWQELVSDIIDEHRTQFEIAIS